MLMLLRVLLTCFLLSLTFVAAETQCWSAHHADPSWFGFPDYHDCYTLLFGNNDLSGIAAIDELSHAFVVPGTTREWESDAEWESRVELPKFWRNSQDEKPGNGCPSQKQANGSTTSVYVAKAQMVHTRADSIEPVQSHALAMVQHIFGADKANQGDTGNLIILIFQPGSRIDREITRDLAENRIVTIAAAELFDENDYDSVDEDLDRQHEEFASLLNIGDEEKVQPRPDSSDQWGYSHVGKSDPRVKNLGNSWVVAYDSVTSLLPVRLAARALSAFYDHIVGIAAEHISKNTALQKSLVFVTTATSLKRLSLTLASPDPIPWEWVIRFAREMSGSLDSTWTVLYKAIARSAYWNVAVIHVALSIAAA
ncbi:MAG: hypothetical protein Q9207_003702 [Kuettlingeria erythrocarpa]